VSYSTPPPLRHLLRRFPPHTPRIGGIHPGWTFWLSPVLQGLGVRELVVYYESMKRVLQTRPIYECRCDERLKTEAEESTRLTYTGLLGELEHLKIETRFIDEMFASVMSEYVFLK
jgi:hypothetical protein